LLDLALILKNLEKLGHVFGVSFLGCGRRHFQIRFDRQVRRKGHAVKHRRKEK
jgi:hypothetical protein